MVLTFSCRQDGQSYVKNPDGEAQYIVKTAHSPLLTGGVYDDLGLSCLVGVEQKAEGFLVSAFDSPLGVFVKEPDGTIKMENEGWEISEAGDRYVLSHSGEKIAEIAVKGFDVALSTEYVGQAIIVIAAALVLLELNNQTKVVEKLPRPEKKEAPKKTAKVKEDKERIISINIDALKKRLSKIKLDKAVEIATEYVPSIRFKVQGKVLIAMVSAILLCLILFFSGLFLAASKNNSFQNIDYANAIVSVEKSGNATASFKVGEYAYSIKLDGKDYKNKETFVIYYTENTDGTLNECFMKKPSSGGYVVMSVISVVLAAVIFVFMFIGNPLDFRKEWDVKALIKRLKPIHETNEEDRMVEHTAYVSSANLEPDFFDNDSKEDN